MAHRVHQVITILLLVGVVATLGLEWRAPEHGTTYPEFIQVIAELERSGVTPQLDAQIEVAANAMGAPGIFVVDTTSGQIVSAYPKSVVGERSVGSAMRKVHTATLVNRLSGLNGGTIVEAEPIPGQRYSLILVSRTTHFIKEIQDLLLVGLLVSGGWYAMRSIRRPVIGT